MDLIKRNRELLGLAAGSAALALTIVMAIEYLGITQPCTLCWTQRLIMGFFTLIASLGIILWPRRRIARLTLGVTLVGVACLGAGVAIRHIYVMWNPQVVECGMSPDMMLKMMPLHEALIEFISGHTDCAEAGSLLGIPLPVWSLSGFIGLGGLAAYALLRPQQ